MAIHFSPQATPHTGAQVQAFVHAWQSGQEVFTLSTSGSTGTPKEIIVPRAYMEASALATAAAIGLQPKKNALICLNTKYIGGIMALVRGLMLDWDMYVAEPSANPLAEIPDFQHPTSNLYQPAYYHASFVPLQLEATLADSEQRALFSTMHSVLVGGAPLSARLMKAVAAVEGVAIYQTFGMTETVSHFALRRLNGNSPDDAYTLLPGYEAQVGTHARLQIAGPTTGGSWLLTNDMVELVGENQFKWLGRTDFVINSGGIKLNPETLEPHVGQILEEMGIATSFYLTSQPDEILGQALLLVLEGTPNAELESTILTRLKLGMPTYSAPKAIRWLERLPSTATGKLIRSTL